MFFRSVLLPAEADLDPWEGEGGVSTNPRMSAWPVGDASPL